MLQIHRNWKTVLFAGVVVALSFLGPIRPAVQAQNSLAGWPEQVFTVLKSQNVASQVRASVARSLKNGTFGGAEDEQQFTEYYNRSIFPNVTNPANRQSQKDDVIVRLRSDLRLAGGEKPKGDEQAKEQQVFTKLAELIVDYMSRIAGDGKYHPAARVNAMLAIGEVNSPNAAKFLLAATLDRRQIFSARVAAMTGLIRMAGPSGKGVLSDPAIGPLVPNMITFVKFRAKNAESGIPKKPDDGICWMRGQAADILAELGEVGPQGEVPTALLVMLGDKDLPIPIRSKAARALAKLKYGGNPPAAGPYLAALADFLSDALSSDQPADRGRIRLVMRDTVDATKAFAESTPAANHALLDGLQKTLQVLNKDTEAPMTPEELKDAIKKAKTSLDSHLKSK